MTAILSCMFPARQDTEDSVGITTRHENTEAQGAKMDLSANIQLLKQKNRLAPVPSPDAFKAHDLNHFEL